MKTVLKWLGGGVALVVGVVLLVVVYQVTAFARSEGTTYDVPPLEMVASTDTAVIARGQHIAESFGGCIGCHGPGLGGKLVEDLGPIGLMRSTNLTRGRGGVGNDYTDGELARAIRYGIRKDGHSLRFMPTVEHTWWPDSDLQAVVSYVRSVPPVDADSPPATVGLMGKLLHQFGMMPVLSATTVSLAGPRAEAPLPAPTAEYGAFLARSCTGCHGEGFSGGRIPGAPSNLATPANLTPHETGLGGWTEAQFRTAIETGVRPDGRQLDPFMPIETTRNMDDVEKRALWAYLASLEPRPFGGR